MSLLRHVIHPWCIGTVVLTSATPDIYLLNITAPFSTPTVTHKSVTVLWEKPFVTLLFNYLLHSNCQEISKIFNRSCISFQDETRTRQYFTQKDWKVKIEHNFLVLFMFSTMRRWGNRIKMFPMLTLNNIYIYKQIATKIVTCLSYTCTMKGWLISTHHLANNAKNNGMVWIISLLLSSFI